MEPAYDRTDLVDGGEAYCIANDVDDTGMTAAGQHHEASSPQMGHQRLVVYDRRIVVPTVAVPGLVRRRHAEFKIGRALDLAGYQNAPVGEQGRPAALGHFEALFAQSVC
jgi:hypothetical protein